METNSSTEDNLNTLARRVDPKKSDEVLQELLNLRFDDEAARSRFLRRFEDVLPTNVFFGVSHSDSWVINSDSVLDASKRIRSYLAEAWRAPTLLAREISLLKIVGMYLDTREEPRLVDSKVFRYNEEYWAKEAASRVDAFVLVLLRALHIADRMRYCPNPACPAPYFIAKKRRQKYCSDACALPAQREFKRAWWDEHGEEWRAKRKRKAERGRKSSRTRRKGGKQS